MDIKDLFKGVAVVIDDEIYDNDKEIFKIVELLENENIPLLKYNDIPDENITSNFNNLSFILLDWELTPSISVSTEGSISGTTETTILKPQIDTLGKKNVEFIKKIKTVTFAPIFIFSHLDPGGIIEKLVDAGLYERDKSNYIFIKNKNELIKDDKLFQEIGEWLRQTPSIYVLKEWEKSLNEAKTKLFWDFYGINHKWPSVLQKTFTDDGSDVNYELGNFIFKNIMARTEPIKFDEEILKLGDIDLTKDEIRKVLEAERFLKQDSLPDLPFTGDLFKVYKYELSEEAISEKELYYLNIRPDCDIVRNSNPELYCLECEIIDETKINSTKSDQIVFDKGTFIEKTVNAYLPFADNGKIFRINFKVLKILKWNQELFPKQKSGIKRNFKQTRIGRILPPYITAIQQKYSFYLQRQGLPAIPEKAIKDD